jgi:hypothetical protein
VILVLNFIILCGTLYYMWKTTYRDLDYWTCAYAALTARIQFKVFFNFVTELQTEFGLKTAIFFSKHWQKILPQFSRQEKLLSRLEVLTIWISSEKNTLHKTDDDKQVVGTKQGDQIGRIKPFWRLFTFRKFFKTYRKSPNSWDTFSLVKAKNLLWQKWYGLHFGRFFSANSSGTDVMITIFCDFRLFSAKKLAFFLKNQCYDQIFA